MPDPPMPSVTMWSKSSADRAAACAATFPASSCAAASCSGMAQSASPNAERIDGHRAGVTPRTWAGCRRPSALATSRVVLGVVDGLGLVDQHDRDVVAHRVAPLQPRVVERRLVLEVEQRALVLRAREDLEQLRVERHAWLLLGAFEVGDYVPRTSASTSAVRVVARGAVGGFEVEAQQRLGVARTQVEPPVADVDGEAVEPVLLGVAVRGGDALDHRERIVDPRVDLARHRVALERLAQLARAACPASTAARARCSAAMMPESAR